MGRVSRRSLLLFCAVLGCCFAWVGCSSEPQPVTYCGHVYAPESTQVRCREEYQSDVEALLALVHLEFVDLVGTRVKRADSLAKIPTLRFLDLSRTQVEGIGKLSDIKELRHLKMNHTLLKDLKGVELMSSLESLEVAWTRVKDIKLLEGAKTLLSMNLDGIEAEDFTPLHSLKRLKRLSLWKTKISREALDELKRAVPGVAITGCDGKSATPCM